MPDPQTTAGPLEALVAALEAWDGRLETARAIRASVRELPDPRRKPNGVAERAIFVARSAYASKGGLGRPEKLAADVEFARRVGPFVGDPELGSWPFHAPLRISDAEAIAWLPVVGRFAPPDDQVRAFVEVMFRTRKRDTWVPASHALAALALRDEKSRERLAQAFADLWPNGLPTRWPSGKLTTAAERVHDARHVLHAACAFLAAGGDAAVVKQLDASKLAAMALPSADQSDASAVLLALTALVASERTRPKVMPHLSARAADSAPDEMQEAALRDIAQALGPCAESAAIVDVLKQPRWRTVPGIRRLDALMSWLDTAMWLHSRGEPDAVAWMRAQAADGAAALALKLDRRLPDGAEDPVDALLPRLRAVLDADVRATTEPARWVMQLAELLLLLDHPRVQKMPWRALVRRAMGPNAPPGVDDTVAAVARAELTAALALADEGSATLLRSAELDASVTLQLASSQNGFVARQVSVQVERLLRELEPGPEQLRLLWRLLQRDPPAETFHALRINLRGEGTPLHALVEAFGRLDEVRERGSPLAEVSRCYREAAAASGELCRSAAAEDGAVPVARLAEALERAAALEKSTEVGTRAWRQGFRAVLLGAGDDGLAAWMRWLGLATDALEPAWKRLDAAVASIVESRLAVTVEQCAELDAAADELKAAVRNLAWPEAHAVKAILEQLACWRAERLDEARRSAKASEACARALDRGDEAWAVAAATSAELELLPPAMLRRLGRFLLDRLLFRAAHRLRARVRERAQIPAVWTHLAPLFAGVASGTFLVLDVGTAWNDVVAAHSPIGLAATVALSLLLSFVLLAGNLASRMAAADEPAPVRLSRVCRRVLPTYALALLLAAGVSGLVLVTLEGTSQPTSRVGRGAAVLATGAPLGIIVLVPRALPRPDPAGARRRRRGVGVARKHVHR